MQTNRKPYYPSGYVRPWRCPGGLLTQAGVVIGGRLDRGVAANDHTPFEAPTQAGKAAVAAAGCLAVLGGAVGVLLIAMVVLVIGLMAGYAVHNITDGASNWSSWSQFRNALTGMTEGETLLLAGCTGISLLPLLLVCRQALNARKKGSAK